jgi:2-aminobenzoate-CoA ligase
MRSGHVDTFAHEQLPPEADRPRITYDTAVAPVLAYPARVNCARAILGDAIAKGFGPRVAVRFEGLERPEVRLTYDDVAALSAQAARVLVEDYGVVPGARVLLRGPNCPMMVVLWFAILRAGGIAVTTMPMLRARELRYMIDKAKVSLSLTAAPLAAELDLAACGIPGHRIAQFRVHPEDDDRPGALLEPSMAAKSASFVDADTDAEDVALIAFTSGTTGPAKGAMHTHRDVLAAADLFTTYELRPTPSDVFFGTPPLAFTFGLGALLLFPFRVGAATLLFERPTAEALFRAMTERGGTILFTAPTMFRNLARTLGHAPPMTTLVQCVSAGETLPRATFDAWQRVTGLGIIDGMGSTEMLHIFICSSGANIRPGATGKVLRGYEARVVDDAGHPVPPGTVGRLFVRGPTGCRYLDDPERQRAYVKDGWNFTGDAFRQDEDGYFWFVARADDMIISAGYNISGPEVEAVLLEHPKVAECAVVGAPDSERGTVVKAFVVLRDGEAPSGAVAAELQEHVKRIIAPYKYPRAVAFVPELPKTETGKIQRFRLRGTDP